MYRHLAKEYTAGGFVLPTDSSSRSVYSFRQAVYSLLITLGGNAGISVGSVFKLFSGSADSRRRALVDSERRRLTGEGVVFQNDEGTLAFVMASYPALEEQ